MADSNFQTDFFEDKYHGKKVRRPRFLDKYSEQRFLPYIRVPVEYTVILGITVLLLMVISYAVGIERGKRMPSPLTAIVEEEKPPAIEAEEIINTVQGEKVPEGFKTNVEEEEIVKEPVLSPKEAKQEKEKIKGDGSVYTIQVASYRLKEQAEREVEKLKKTGKDASFERKGTWYQVYVQGYETIKEAREAKETFTKEYPDCYIRRSK